MRYLRHAKWMTPTALALAASSVLAGQITLYEGGEFQGRSMPTSSDLSVVAAASSVIVNDGTWEVCTSAYYHGQCAQLPPGKYARIDATLNAPIVSARQLASAELPGGNAISRSAIVVNPAPLVDVPGRIVLFEYPNFAGTSVVIERGQARDLDWAAFNNPYHRATSIRVEAGSWRVCSRMMFEGECQILGPGEYPALTGSLFTGIASAQQVYRPEYGALKIYAR